MGVSSSRAPSDIPGVYDVPIGASGAARYAEMVSHGVTEAEKLLTRYLLIDKIKPPWLPISSQIAETSLLDPPGPQRSPVRDYVGFS